MAEVAFRLWAQRDGVQGRVTEFSSQKWMELVSEEEEIKWVRARKNQGGDFEHFPTGHPPDMGNRGQT